jgi:hypothetical protein
MISKNSISGLSFASIINPGRPKRIRPSKKGSDKEIFCCCEQLDVPWAFRRLLLELGGHSRTKFLIVISLRYLLSFHQQFLLTANWQALFFLICSKLFCQILVLKKPGSEFRSRCGASKTPASGSVFEIRNTRVLSSFVLHAFFPVKVGLCNLSVTWYLPG